MRENVFVYDLERKVFILFAVTVVAILLGPFGTYDSLTLWQRAVFWSLLFGGSFLCMMPILHVFGQGRLVSRLPVTARVVGAVLCGSLPITALTILLLHNIRDQQSGVVWTSFPKIYMQVFGISLGIFLVEFYFWPKLVGGLAGADDGGSEQGSVSDPETASPPPVAPAPTPAADCCRLAERLPHELRAGRIISISMQDHYAHIATTDGEALVLIRLGDAIALLDGLPGVQTHRSHWAAEAFAREIHRDGRRHFLTLADGRQLPVAAARVKDVKAMLERKATGDRQEDSRA